MEVTIPAGLQPADRKVLRGRGIQRLRTSDRGDQIIEFDVQIPKRLDARQKQLLQEAFLAHDKKHEKHKSEPNEPAEQRGEKKGFFKSAMEMLKCDEKKN